MTSDQRSPASADHAQHPYADRWRLLERAYFRLNRLSHHVLGACIKLIVLFYLLFCLFCLVLRYVLLPQIGNYKADIEHVIGASLGRSVSISQIYASWQGLRPNLQLKQVSIHDEQGRNALVLPNVEVTVSWLSVLFNQVRFYDLQINQAELELKRSVDGKIFIAGWWLDPGKKGDAQGLNWILSQRQITINGAVIHWTDEQRGAPELTLSNVNFVMQNQWREHRFSLTATPPAELAGPIDVRADFSHRPFSDNMSNYKEWKGQLFADFSKTDLAHWKSYIDYPFEIQSGIGSVRAWYTFDEQKMVDFTADLKLSNVKTWLRKDLQTLDLLTVSGRISAQEINVPDAAHDNPATAAERLFSSGHQISLTNFSFETRNGFRLPPTTLTERYMPASRTGSEQLQFSAKFLDLNVLANLIEHFPMPKEYALMLQNFEPAGQLSNFSVSLQGKFPALDHYQVKGNFSNLAMRPQAAKPAVNGDNGLPAIPGFTNLTGAIDANERKGVIQLASTNLVWQLPDYFSEPVMQFDRLDLQAGWEFNNKNQMLVNFSKLDLVQQEMHAHFSGTHLIPLDQDKALGFLDLTGSVSNFDVQKLNRYLPLTMQDDLHHWLSRGIEQGILDDVNVRIRGDMADFPFVKKGLLDQNIFNITGKIIDGKINYLPDEFGKDNVHPYWPVLSKIQGKIIFDRESLEIDADSGETEGIGVAKVKARIPDLLSADAKLEIEGLATGPAQDMIHYLSVSPILEWIGNFTQDTKISGPAKLKLKLDLPLFHMIDAKVAGEVQLNGNDVALIHNLPLISQVNGRISFNEHGLSLNALKGLFLGGPVGVVGGTQKDGIIRIRAEGQLALDGVRKAYPETELKRLLARADGNAPYTAIIQVKSRQTEIWVDSTLQGMTLRLPAPLNKSANEQLPLHFELVSLPSLTGKAADGVPVQQDEMKVSFGKVVNVRYLRQKTLESAPWKVISGGIGVNVPAPQPDSGVSAYIELASLNVDDLSALLPDKLNTSSVAEAGKPADSARLDADLGQYLLPDELAARTVELTVMGKKLNQVVFGASRPNGIWQANIDSKQITGYLTWNNADHGLGYVTARLGSLSIPENAANDVVELLQSKDIHSSIPGLDVVADSVELFGKKLGRLELRAKNVNSSNEPSTNEWQIEKLNIVNPDGELNAEGKWTNGSEIGNAAGTSIPAAPVVSRFGPPRSNTTLKYQLDLMDAGKLLDRLGYPRLILGGKGKLTGEISWAGSPYSLDIPSLSGRIQLDLLAGQFLKVEPGAAKLLAVLNLQALPRRLMLDFRDVFSDGFAFDGINGSAEIDRGVAKTDNLKMRSVSATVLLSGTADIAGETQNLHVVVVPEVNAGAASVVYGLAVNPVIGLGTFLAQLFLREPLMKAFTFEYQVTGPWKEPNVVKL